MHIKIIGDSLAAGAGSSLSYETSEIIFEDMGIAYHQFVAPNGWGSLLENYLHGIDSSYVVRNKGCCGAYSYQIDMFLEQMVTAEDELILVLAGANDRKRIRGMEELKKNSERIICRLRSMGKTVVLLTPNPSVHSNEYRANRIYHTDEVVEVLREAAKKNNVCLIDNYQYILDYIKDNQLQIDNIMQEEGCQSDGLHPTDFVQRLIFENVLKELKEKYICRKG